MIHILDYYASLLMLENEMNKYQFIMVLNSRVKHCIQIYSPYLLKAIIEKSCEHKINIKYTHYPLPMTNDLKEQNIIGNNLTIVFFHFNCICINAC